MQNSLLGTSRQEDQTHSRRKIVKKWAIQRWRERWEHYLPTVPPAKRTPAHDGELGRRREKLHEGLHEIGSLLAIQLRTGKIGFTTFLHARRVPDVISPACQCGWRWEDPKHVVIFCPNRARNHRNLYEAARTNRYREILSTGKGLRAVARWVMNEGLLARFPPAKEKIDRAEGRTREDGEEEGEASERE